jgi:hypothetical protein
MPEPSVAQSENGPDQIEKFPFYEKETWIQPRISIPFPVEVAMVDGR